MVGFLGGGVLVPSQFTPGHNNPYELDSRPWGNVLDTTVYGKACQLVAK